MNNLRIIKQEPFDRRVFLTCDSNNEIVGINYQQGLSDMRVEKDIDTNITTIHKILSEMNSLNMTNHGFDGLGYSAIHLIDLAIAIDTFTNLDGVMLLDDEMLFDGTLGYCSTEPMTIAFYKWLSDTTNNYYLSDCFNEALEDNWTQDEVIALKFINLFITHMCKEDGVPQHTISQLIAEDFMEYHA